MTKTDQQIADWFNAELTRDACNPPTTREVAQFMGVRSNSTASTKLAVLEAKGLIPGYRRKKVAR